MARILLIEDNENFAVLIQDFLGQRSIDVTICDDPFKAVVMPLDCYDLILLDLGLPGMDGLEVCRDLRKKSTIPIIISSARNSTADKVSGLQIGADDYLPKPYEPDELHARITSVLRRVNSFTQQEQSTFVIDENARDMHYRQQPLFLTQAEYEIAVQLVKNYGHVVSKEQLQYNSCAITSTEGKNLENLISRIRNKIKPYSQKKHIVAIRGRGYRLVD
ncbi:MAG: response regulator transcription factor [Campylobacterota bacterium]